MMVQETFGDRRTLTEKEERLLDGTIIPTAHRWLREWPFLAHHAVKLLRFWKEPIVDDYGNPYVSEEEKKEKAKRDDELRAG